MKLYSYKVAYIDYNGYMNTMYVDAITKEEAYENAYEQLPIGCDVEYIMADCLIDDNYQAA